MFKSEPFIPQAKSILRRNNWFISRKGGKARRKKGRRWARCHFSNKP
jgi:hypothetical protein